MSQDPPPIITLLTDFGLSDSYVAAMKGVILAICRPVELVDITHLVAPQQVSSGAYLLASCYRDFPPGTIHLAVVDPGVGSARKPLAIRIEGHILVGPDNGIFSLVLDREKDWQARTIAHPKLCRSPVSATFHGRDLFAPAAAHLAAGFAFEQVGPICRPLRRPRDPVIQEAQAILGRIIHIDRFGNAISNIRDHHLRDLPKGVELQVLVAGMTVTVHEIYDDVAAGTALALIGGSGHLEISVNGGSAEKALGLKLGDEIRLRESRRR